MKEITLRKINLKEECWPMTEATGTNDKKILIDLCHLKNTVTRKVS